MSDYSAFCPDEFWDEQISVNTTSPDLTKCFQDTVLTWVPCFFLYLLSPIYFYKLHTNTRSYIPHTWLNITQTSLSVVLAVLCAAEMGYRLWEHQQGYPLHAATILAPACRFIAMVLCVALVQFGRKKGQRSCGLLFLHWLLQFLAMTIMLYSRIRHVVVEGYTADHFLMATVVIFTTLALVQLILAGLVDKPSVFSDVTLHPNVCPEQQVSFPSRMTFWWFTALVVKGYKQSLTREDLWTLNPRDTSENVVPQFTKQWDRQLAEARKAQEAYAKKHCNGIEEVEVPLKTFTPANQPEVKVRKGAKDHKPPQPNLALALVRTFGPMYLVGSAFKFMHDCLMFISPMLLKALIQYTRDETIPTWRGYSYALLMFAVAFTQSLVLHQYFHRCFVTGMRIRTSVIASVYEKSLKLSNAARKQSTVGEVVNLMSVDAQRFMELVTYLNMIWSAPFQICVSLYFLWMLLGPSVLAGVAVMILVIPINAVIAKKNKQLQMSQMKHKDSRIKLMNEVLNGIKVLKLYAWELSFKEKVLAIRNLELETLKKSAYLHAASSFAWSVTPFMVSLVSFAVYVLSSPDNVLDAETAFVSLSLFNILRFPLSMLPMLIANMVQARVSLTRLQKFLINEELDPSNIQVVDKMESAISINHGSFSWERNPEELKHTLNDINIEIKEGELVAIVGQVGSGKSSLLAAMLGEMEKEAGLIKMKGSVAYVAQQAWIQNATLKDNILFTNKPDEDKMNSILDACALKPDLDILPGREMTEIGEKGINLSGGQKARVSLARSVYSEADIYLLDDPLSAVDPHVGRHIFDNVLGPNGLLKGKTRVLVTHGLSYLPQCDQIFVIVDGRISEVGTYTELLAQSGNFADILKTYLTQEHDEEGLDELETEEKEVKEEIGSPGSVKRIRRDTHTSTESDSQQHVHSNGSLAAGGKRSLTSSCTSLAEKDREIVEKSIREQERREAESRLIETERSETGRVKLSVLRAYLSAMGAWVTVVIVILFTLNNACSIFANFWLSAWADDINNYNVTAPQTGDSNGNITATNGTMVTGDTSDEGGRIMVDAAQRDMRLGVYGALGFGQSVCVYLAGFVLVRGATRATGFLHSRLLQASLRAPMTFFDTTPVGRIVNRFSKDVDVIDTLIPRNLEAWFKCTFHVLGTLFVISFSTPFFLVVAFPLGFFYYIVQRFYVATSRQLKRIESVSRSPIYSHFGETIQGATTIRAYRQQQRFMHESQAKVDENQVAYYPSIVSNRWLAIRLEFVGQFIVLFSAIFAVMGRDYLTAGIVGLSISYALNITQTLNWMVRMTSELETNIVAVERVKEYSEIQTEAAWEVPDKKPAPLWPEEGRLDIEKYSTRYREGMDLVLRGVYAHIQGGEKVGIVGRTGAGKSSLTMALFRIIEAAEGSITIDGIRTADIGLHDLRSKLTIIPQEPVLFSGSLRMNLDPFEQYSDEQLWGALEHAHLRSFVSAQAEQLDYECTEGGENLSVGQRQLVCLARALLRKTRILILDEATAAVDMETDDLIQATIRKEFVDSTVLTIAHRLNTIMDYSRIMVLDQGNIAEFDTPKSLLNKKGIFYSMARDAGLAD